MPSFTRESGGTLHVAVMGVNRIGKEATSSLDSITEGVIQENLAEISHGATMLIIAHRLSTVIHADQILVIEDGEITERGTHQSLLAATGPYAALWAKQQKEKDQEIPVPTG